MAKNNNKRPEIDKVGGNSKNVWGEGLEKLQEIIGRIRRRHVFIVLVVFSLVGLFYWFQYRPSKIRAACDKQATKAMGDAAAVGKLSGEAAIRVYDFWYASCLRARGIER